MVRLFGVEIPNPNVKTEEKAKRTKQRKSIILFGQKIVPQRRKSDIKKTRRSSSSPSPPAAMPFPLAQAIREMDGKDLIFVTRKILERSDTATDQNRFFVPKSEVLWGLLSEEEKTAVEGGGGLGVTVVDPTGGKYSMKMKKWVSLNKIVLNSGWRKFVENNELKAEVDCIEAWCFRARSTLCFAFNVNRLIQ